MLSATSAHPAPPLSAPVLRQCVAACFHKVRKLCVGYAATNTPQIGSATPLLAVGKHGGSATESRGILSRFKCQPHTDPAISTRSVFIPSGDAKRLEMHGVLPLLTVEQHALAALPPEEEQPSCNLDVAVLRTLVIASVP
eukprot:COSAG01_NODE_19080_length_1032_cov_0.821008_2_plen_140_part_00